MQTPTAPKDTEGRNVWTLLAAAERGVCFGPLFFLEHLQGFVRDRCPDPVEGLPGVRLGLADGTSLEVCHIIGVTPKWIALAVYETERDEEARRMRTELVPYAMITRLTIRAEPGHGPQRMGFNVASEPAVIAAGARAGPRTPEEALRAVARKGARKRGS